MPIQPATYASRTSYPPVAPFPVAALTPAPLALVIRPVLPSDRATIERGFEALTPDSRYNRFHAPMHRLPEWLARYLTEVDGIDHVALIGFAQDTQHEGDAVGVARFVRNRKAPETAELAITIADELQGRGIARRFLTHLARAARERGIRAFTMDVLKGNRKARRFVASIGALPTGSVGEVISFAVPVDAL